MKVVIVVVGSVLVTSQYPQVAWQFSITFDLVHNPLLSSLAHFPEGQMSSHASVRLARPTKSRPVASGGAGGARTVCWIGVKVAVLYARQYMPSNLLIIKVLNIFLYFKHQISTGICSEAYLKHYWRNCLQKLQYFTFVRDNFFNNVLNMLLSKS